MKRVVTFICILVSFTLLCSCKKKEVLDFPTKGITVICPWTEGGGTDSVLRALCSSAEKYLNTQITVENRIGGAGASGHAAIKDARPDGYTLGMITFELNSLPQQGLVSFTYEDFDPLIRVNADAAALTVKADAPYNTLEEFISYCKAHPGTVAIGNSAPGSVWHIGAGLLAESAGIEVKHISFEGAAGAVSAVANGYIQAVTVSLAEVKAQYDSGAVKVLGVMDAHRPAHYPEIPTFKEMGYPIEYATWRGLALPKGVSPSVKQILHEAFSKAVADPDFIKTAEKLNLTIAYQNSQDFSKFLKENYAAITTTMKSIHIIQD
ncbi:MAG: tripartite tricarboxylate transporter substrate binding protein [Treponema sp.]|nr:tripartite tricarboxylate transporter substrate binding protein [Treponema sp.]